MKNTQPGLTTSAEIVAAYKAATSDAKTASEADSTGELVQLAKCLAKRPAQEIAAVAQVNLTEELLLRAYVNCRGDVRGWRQVVEKRKLVSRQRRLDRELGRSPRILSGLGGWLKSCFIEKRPPAMLVAENE